jgi:hypothetical protein
VDDLDLATLAGLRYARSLRPTTLRAVHFVIDSVQADTLRQDWVRARTGIALDLVDCPDRRLARATAEMVSAEAVLPGVGVTAILPRRVYTPLLGRLLHDRTADKMAAVVSQIPYAVATIVPFDVRRRLAVLHARDGGAASQPGRGDAAAAPAPAAVSPEPGAVSPEPGAVSPEPTAVAPQTAATAPAPIAAAAPMPATAAAEGDCDDYNKPVPSAGVSPIGTLVKPGRAVVEGRVHAVEIRPVQENTVLACEIADSTGRLTALFYGRSHIPGLDPGARVRFRGPVGIREGHAIMINPAYDLLAPGSGGLPRT